MRWSIDAPSIIAEDLVGVPDALLTALRPGPPAPGRAVAAILARSLSPAEDPVHPPFWLLPQQGLSFRRVLAALHRYRGALLADPVGSGKTFVALAAAAEVNRGSTLCLVPASLVPQWRAAAGRLSVPVTLCSHEQVSRGNLPVGTRGLVIIDESHHFRNPQTRRYRHLAPWLVGRPALLLTATPIVNRVLDLGHQLLLAVRDDALTLDGVSSLRTMLRCSQPSPALGQLVFQSRTGLESRPRRVQGQSKPVESECLMAAGMVELVSALQLSRQGAIAGLIRLVLLRAGASSPAALGGALRRYRRLLLHAHDAVDTGRVVDRNELKRFTRELDDQLVWWELLPVTDGVSELELSDLPRLEQIIEWVDAAGQAVDGKLERLRNLLLDGTPTLVFVGSRDTVRYIRTRLSDLRVAWCTGEKAGIGSTILSRQTVLAWFREAPQDTMAPVHLVVTDVAAEGLDLQRAARVIHYDLPWTPMRMEQREGRAVRYGSNHTQVEVVRFPLPRVLEQQLRVHSSLARKHKLPASVGLGSSGRQVWQWRAEAAAKLSGVTAAHGVAGIQSQTEGLLAGIALYRTGEPRPLSATVLWVEPGGDWTEAPDIIAAKLEAAATHAETRPLDRSRLNEWLSVVAKPIRERLAFTRGRRWVVPELNPGTRQALTRLQVLVRDAARKRDAGQLAELERTIAFVAGGHTAGEAELVNRLAQARDPEFRSMVRALPRRSVEEQNIEVQLTGLIVWGPAKVVGNGLLSSECPAFRPPCSISTAP